MNPNTFTKIPLDDNHNIYLSPVIDQFNWSYERFAALWETHPENYHTLKIHGKEVLTPRWQQAYGKNYRYTGSKNNALEMTELLEYSLWAELQSLCEIEEKNKISKQKPHF
jgi:hypothetical protein